MYLTLVSDVALLESYLRSRESTGLFHKQRWHVFATGNPAVIDAIYANVEFQYHAQTGDLPRTFSFSIGEIYDRRYSDSLVLVQPNHVPSSRPDVKQVLPNVWLRLRHLWNFQAPSVSYGFQNGIVIFLKPAIIYSMPVRA